MTVGAEKALNVGKNKLTRVEFGRVSGEKQEADTTSHKQCIQMRGNGERIVNGSVIQNQSVTAHEITAPHELGNELQKVPRGVARLAR